MKIRKIISFIVAFVLITMSVCQLNTINALADVSGYSADLALQYAAEHWDDGEGLCAEFVSKCVIAGGLDMPVCPMVYYCVPAVVNASGVQPIELRLDEWGLATKELDEDILGPGDVVFHYCKTHPDSIRVMPHVIICAGYDEEGYAVYYAHNGACNKRRIRLNINTAYEHEKDCDMVGMVIHLSGTIGELTNYQDNSVVFYDKLDTEKYAISEHNAVVGKTISLIDANINQIEEVSFRLYDDKEEVLAENVIDYEVLGDRASVWVDIKKTTGVKLKKHKYYQYQFIVKVDGKEYNSYPYRFFTYDPNEVIERVVEEPLSMVSYLDEVYSEKTTDPHLLTNDGNLLNYKVKPTVETVDYWLLGSSATDYVKCVGARAMKVGIRNQHNNNGFRYMFLRKSRVISKIKRKKLCINKKKYNTATVKLYIYNASGKKVDIKTTRKVMNINE